jgi:hypothetical protein
MCNMWQPGQPTVGTVQVGSLIFVVIVATWAAYLLQHWIHRREDAVASESVERFSSAMRVLEQRTATALAAPAHAGTSRAGEGVASSTALDAAHRSPLVARRAAGRESTVAQRDPMTSHPDPRGVAPAGTRPVSRTDARPAPRPADPRPAPRPAGARPAPQPSTSHVSRAHRLVRAAVLLLALLWVPVSVGLAIARILLWISVPLAVLTLLAVLFWLRTEARGDRARAARDENPRRRRPAAPTLSSDDTQVIYPPAARSAAPSPARPADVVAAATGPIRAASATTSAAHRPAAAVPAVASPAATPAAAGPAATPAAAGPAAGASSAAYDFQADEARQAPAEPAGPLAEGEWRPVPVPPPTYTMKAKAEPRMTDAGIPADVFSTPEFAEEAEELDERALFVRRAANQ